MGDPGELVPDESLELFHNFETELHRLVTANRDIRLEASTSTKRKSVQTTSNSQNLVEIRKMYLHDRLISEHYNGLRTAANNLDMVALVTRLQHWIIKLTRQCPELTEPRDRESTLTANLRRLNSFLGDGPRLSDFFQGLESFRDSVIHGDSKAEWRGQRINRVPPGYANPSGETAVSDGQLEDAVRWAIAQGGVVRRTVKTEEIIGMNHCDRILLICGPRLHRQGCDAWL